MSIFSPRIVQFKNGKHGVKTWLFGGYLSKYNDYTWSSREFIIKYSTMSLDEANKLFDKVNI